MDSLSVSVNEASRMLGVGRTHLYDCIRAGHLATKKLGNRRRVRVDSIRAYLERDG